MAHFSCFPGASALSDFRQTRLLDTLRQIDANIVAVRGQFLHFVNAAEPLSADDSARIDALMHYGAPFQPAGEKGATETFIVLPRFGTVDSDDSALLAKMIAEHPFTPYSEVEIKPLVDPATAMGIRNQNTAGQSHAAVSAPPSSGPTIRPSDIIMV